MRIIAAKATPLSNCLTMALVSYITEGGRTVLPTDLLMLDAMRVWAESLSSRDKYR